MPEIVECHSGSRFGERPRALHWEGQRLEVRGVLRRWREPGRLCFQVQTEEDRAFELCFDEHTGQWSIRAI